MPATKITKKSLAQHIKPPAGVHRKTAKKGGAKKRKGGMFPLAAALPFLLAGTAPILGRLGSKIAGKLGLGKGIIRSGSSRMQGGYVIRRR